MEGLEMQEALLGLPWHSLKSQAAHSKLSQLTLLVKKGELLPHPTLKAV